MNMALKVILAFFNTTNLEKADTFPTQVNKSSIFSRKLTSFTINSDSQAIVGTIISAMTGTTDPHEVAKMAKQAVQVKIRIS